ncbi:MAG TPA: protein kinase, partial [Ktedonobacteraceae bacterium]|nr:protein kinase [Ktedonobacteraceae bacterium]
MSTFNSLTGKLTPQSILMQRYLIVQLAGRGGMSAIYQALDMKMEQRRVAIKEMSQENLDEQERAEAVARFQQEARLLGSLQHPNLPHIYDAFGINGRSFLVMDYIEGKTLLELLHKAGQPLLVDQVLSYAEQLCDVLAYLHQQRPPVIFRDLKPTNVMVTPGGHVYLIDFGIARFFKEGQAQDTVMLGSPGYAPPEQHGSGQTNPRSDLYALGATLHCCLSNRDPYYSTDRFTFAPVRHFNAQVPPELDRLIARLLTLDENKRPASALEVKQALSHIRQQGQHSSARIPAIPMSVSAPGPNAGPPRPASSPMPSTPGQGEVQAKLVLRSTPSPAPQSPFPPAPDSRNQPYPARQSPTSQSSVQAHIWTPGFLLIFCLLLILTMGGTFLVFTLPVPYQPGNHVSPEHASETGLIALALFVALIALARSRHFVASLLVLVNILAIGATGFTFLWQAAHDLQPSMPHLGQLDVIQINQILTCGLLVAGISSLCWLFRQPASWGQRLWIIFFSGMVSTCAYWQSLY